LEFAPPEGLFLFVAETTQHYNPAEPLFQSTFDGNNYPVDNFGDSLVFSTVSIELTETVASFYFKCHSEKRVRKVTHPAQNWL
jgi:hypothetical protein